MAAKKAKKKASKSHPRRRRRQRASSSMINGYSVMLLGGVGALAYWLYPQVSGNTYDKSEGQISNPDQQQDASSNTKHAG